MATKMCTDRFTSRVMDVLSLVQFTDGDQAISVGAKQISKLVESKLAECYEQLQEIGLQGRLQYPVSQAEIVFPKD